jgi:stage III sporulation protein AB
LQIYFSIAGAVFVIAAAVMTSYQLCSREKRAVRLLKNVANAYSQVAADIRTGYTSLPDAFERVCEKTHDEAVKKYFDDLHGMLAYQDGKDGLREACGKITDIKTVVDICAKSNFSDMLTEKDVEMLAEFGVIPVHLDVVMQINFIDELVCQIRNRIEEMSDAISVKCRVYKAVCLCAGMMIVIMLI